MGFRVHEGRDVKRTSMALASRAVETRGLPRPRRTGTGSGPGSDSGASGARGLDAFILLLAI
jgi:hypothetical protein